MTIANSITILRILLIPVFVMFVVYYGASVARGEPQEWIRWSAIVVFLIASVSDAFDGWLARRLNQVSRLGAALDPIADKGLLLSAIIALSLSPWEDSLPLWFPILVIARDLVIVTGCVVVHWYNNRLEVRPTFIGKAATALQMTAVTWVMLQLPYLEIPVILAGLATLISGLEYVVQGVRQLSAPDSTNASS